MDGWWRGISYIEIHYQVLSRSGLLRMIWPAQSPDLNHIENLWRLIKIRVSERRHRIRTVEERKDAIKEEWERLTEDFRKCVESMHNRCKLVIKAKGGSIKYWRCELLD